MNCVVDLMFFIILSYLTEIFQLHSTTEFLKKLITESDLNFKIVYGLVEN